MIFFRCGSQTAPYDSQGGLLEHGGEGGNAPPVHKEQRQGDKSALLMLCTNIIFSHFLLAFNRL